MPELTEAYSCAGSTYWAAKGFGPLLLPRDHAFWQSEEKPLPCEETDFQRAVPQAGLVVRSHNGDVEVLNNANGICVGNIKFGTWKWGKLSFRSGLGGEIAPAENRYPLDSALTAEFEDGSISGRHQCQPIAVENDHCGSVYGLGNRFNHNHVTVETRLWWKGGWQLHWHHILAYQASLMRLGSYSLPIEDLTQLSVERHDTYGVARTDEQAVAIQPLMGFETVRQHDSDPMKRTHFMALHSVVLTAETDSLTGERDLLALTWGGRAVEESQPWAILSSSPGQLELRHPKLGEWTIAVADLPEIPSGEA
jgi:hypothetical protein